MRFPTSIFFKSPDGRMVQDAVRAGAVGISFKEFCVISDELIPRLMFSTASVPIQTGSTGSEAEIRTSPLASNPSRVRKPSMGAAVAQACGRQAVGSCTGKRVFVRSYPAKTSGRRKRKNKLASDSAATTPRHLFGIRNALVQRDLCEFS